MKSIPWAAHSGGARNVPQLGQMKHHPQLAQIHLSKHSFDGYGKSGVRYDE
jgi:hypothetical protein